MNELTHHFVKGQVPDFIKSDYPNFIAFLEAYYKFLDQYTVSLERERDIDLTQDSMLFWFKQEFASKFPQALIDDRKLVKIIRQLYAAKGTVNAIELLFRIFFSEAIIVKQPGRQILRASDGRWSFRTSITLQRVYGDFDRTRDITLIIENTYGIFELPVDSYDIIDYLESDPTIPNRVRFFYRSNQNVVFETDETLQKIDIIEDSDIAYRGKIILSPTTIEVVAPGEGFKQGQILYVPGTTEDTIVRVTSVVNGGITETQIYHYGLDHGENQLVYVAPHIGVGPALEHDIEFVYTNIDEKAWTLTLHDGVIGVTDEVVGTDTDGLQALYTKTGFGSATTTTSLVDPNLTLQEWLASLATLKFKQSYIVTYAGSFLTDDGQISNPNIRLQDNYFYQLFSYVIQTERNISEYRNVLNLIHPAGLKFFSELTKTTFISFEDMSVTRTISKDTIYINDLTEVLEELSKHVYTVWDDEQIISDIIAAFNVTKILDDSTGATETLANWLTKVNTEELTVTETMVNSVTSVQTDSLSGITDTIVKGITNILADSTSLPADTTIFNINSVLADSSTIADGTPDTPTEIIYQSQDWHSGDYVLDEITLTIG